MIEENQNNGLDSEGEESLESADGIKEDSTPADEVLENEDVVADEVTSEPEEEPEEKAAEESEEEESDEPEEITTEDEAAEESPEAESAESEDTQIEEDSDETVEEEVEAEPSKAEDSAEEADEEEAEVEEAAKSDTEEPDIQPYSTETDFNPDDVPDPEPEVEEEEVSVIHTDEETGEKIDSSKGKWYAVRTFSGQEKKVRETLLATVKREDFEERIFSVYVPSENVVEMRDGKKRTRNKVFFPGYLLVQMDLDQETRYLIENTYGILNFIGPGNKPQALQSAEVKRILGETDEMRFSKSIEVPFSVGDSIKVTDGPFNDFTGFVQDINEEKQKVKVMVSIFGRATPVELDFLQVELEK